MRLTTGATDPNVFLKPLVKFKLAGFWSEVSTELHGLKEGLETDRGPLPGDPADLVGGRAQLVEAQGGGQRREGVVLEEAARLQAALPQSLVVLVQVLHRLAVGSDAPVLLPAVLKGGGDARHDAGLEGPGKLTGASGSGRSGSR